MKLNQRGLERVRKVIWLVERELGGKEDLVWEGFVLPKVYHTSTHFHTIACS